MSYKVEFLPSGCTVELSENETLANAARLAGVELETPCGGQGRCRRCKVVVIGPTTDDGRELLAPWEWEAGIRLACRCRALGDLVVMVSSTVLSKMKVTAEHGPLCNLPLDPIVKEGHGLAVDIGTTTVVASLLDMGCGEELLTASDYNHQIIAGEDVLSRMDYASEGGTAALRGMVLETINGLIDRMNDEVKVDVRVVSIAANTVMTHLFLGVDPSPLRNPPFRPLVSKTSISGREAGLNVGGDATILLFPSLSSYVGGDIVADILYSGMHKDDRLTLLIDVGTNGEVVLGNSDLLVACSSSAGPAFEGGEVSCGTRACPGAVESVFIDDSGIKISTIDGAPPIGLCGSGLIDLLAQLFLNGLIDKKGYFTERAKTIDDDSFKILPLHSIREGLYISEPEIHSIIRTKAAIFAASRTLLSNLGLSFSDLDRVFIAGGFGRHIHLESAITIGLLPDLPRERFHFLGNAALAGAKEVLLHRSKWAEAQDIVRKMTYLDLSSDASFFDEYTSALFIPHTDESFFPAQRNKSL